MAKLINTVFYGHGPWASNTLMKLLEREYLQLNLVVTRFHFGDKDI